MPKLNKNTYFSPTNKYLSNSKIKDFAKDKAYFFRKHILGEAPPFKKTPPMIIGSAVDLWLTGSEKEFREQYILVSRRDTSDEFQLNPTMYKEVEDICTIVSAQDCYKSLKTYKTQKILQYDMPIGEHLLGVCGCLDFLKVKDNKAIIIDLKTANNVIPDKYYWTCKSMGYIQQLAMYRKLTYLNFPGVEEVECWHLVVDTTNELHPVYTFKFTKDEVNDAETTLDQQIDQIKAEKEFKPRNVNWDEAIIIGREAKEF